MLLYDNNQVTCDGPLDWINTEDTNAKMRACGWEVLDVTDGRYDVSAIVRALQLARHSQQTQAKPVLINIRTVIGVDTAMAGTARAHHGAFDKESIARSKVLAGLPPAATHVVPDRALRFFRERKLHGMQIEQEWNELVGRYAQAHPDKAASFSSCRRGEFGKSTKVLEMADSAQFKGMPTRKINGIILEQLWKETTSLCGGGADLVNSNNLRYAETDVFGPNVSQACLLLSSFPSIPSIGRNCIPESQQLINHWMAKSKGLLWPIHTLRHPGACNGRRLQRPRGLQPRHIPAHHGHILHVLYLRRLQYSYSLFPYLVPSWGFFFFFFVLAG